LKGGTEVQVSVDLGKCRSYGLCVALAPDVFEFDSDGSLHLIQSDVPDDRLDVEEAASVCPTQAITIAEAEH
jgi:ferredoxin